MLSKCSLLLRLIGRLFTIQVSVFVMLGVPILHSSCASALMYSILPEADSAKVTQISSLLFPYLLHLIAPSDYDVTGSSK